MYIGTIIDGHVIRKYYQETVKEIVGRVFGVRVYRELLSTG